jgi:hypothetical protein
MTKSNAKTSVATDVVASQVDTEVLDPADAGQPAYNRPDRRGGLRGERRGSVVDRRLGLERRRGPGKRRSDDRRSAEEGEMTDEQFEFLMSVEEYKRINNRPFPSWTEVLDIIHAMGYRRVADPGQVR